MSFGRIFLQPSRPRLRARCCATRTSWNNSEPSPSCARLAKWGATRGSCGMPMRCGSCGGIWNNCLRNWNWPPRADVAYSIELAATDKADPFNSDAASVQKVTAAGDTVTVDFKAPVGYEPWQQFL